LFTARPTARSLAALRDIVRSRNPSKSTLAHDAVATAVLHKHHPIIRVGAGLIQFVHRSNLRFATEATRNRNAFSPFFPHHGCCLVLVVSYLDTMHSKQWPDLCVKFLRVRLSQVFSAQEGISYSYTVFAHLKIVCRMQQFLDLFWTFRSFS